MPMHFGILFINRNTETLRTGLDGDNVVVAGLFDQPIALIQVQNNEENYCLIRTHLIDLASCSSHAASPGLWRWQCCGVKDQTGRHLYFINWNLHF